MITKTDFDNAVSSLDSKIAVNKAKNEFNINYSFFSLVNSLFHRENGFQVYLIFQPILRYVRVIANNKYISEWKSKGLPDESIKTFRTSNNSLTPFIDYHG